MNANDLATVLEDNQRLRIENDQLRKDFEFDLRERNAAICERDAAILERDKAQVDQRLIDELWDRRTEMTDMKEQIKRLREERDAARREVCHWMNTDESGCIKHGSKETAITRGWDCFKEETQ
jgi:regulator of replication initiation timing